MLWPVYLDDLGNHDLIYPHSERIEVLVYMYFVADPVCPQKFVHIPVTI